MQTCRTIAEYLFVNHNGTGTKAAKYLPSHLFMLGFRKLEPKYLTANKTPRDLTKYIYIRIVAFYPGRSGAEMRMWQRRDLFIRELWVRISIPKGWKNTKSNNKMKPYIKVSNKDPLYGAVVEYMKTVPKGGAGIRDSQPLFLRPKKKWIVT